MDATTDIQIVEVTSIDSESSQMEFMAKLAAQRLSQAYPNHIWAIGWAPGLTLVIKHLMGDSKYGYTVDVARAGSISEIEKAVVMGGGELLERLGFRRGAWNGDLPTTTYEGVPMEQLSPVFGFK